MLYLFTVMESVIMMIMFLIMFPTRCKGLKAAAGIILGTAAMSALTLLIINLPLHIKTLITVIIYTSACLCVFSTKWQNALMMSLLGCYEIIACDIISANLIAIAANTPMMAVVAPESGIYLFLGIISKLFAMAVVIGSALFLRKLDFNAPLRYSIILNVILLLLSFANLFFGKITSAVTASLDHLEVVIMCVSYMMIVILVLVLFFNLCKYFSTEAELSYSNLKNDFLEQQLEQQKSAEKSIRTIKHDMLNHLSALNYLNKNGETERFDSYMQTLISRTSVPFKTSVTGIQMLDAILALKSQVAKDHGITIKPVCTGVKHYPDVSEYCLSSIFANLLDNAIEGAGSADENDREIAVDITENAGCINVRITNHYIDNAQNEIVAAGKGHIHKGLGISIAKNAAEESNGMFEYTAEDGIFTAMVVLPVSERSIA